MKIERMVMRDLSPFCTCKDLKCPLHPTNHDKGCSLCIAKNLKQGEVPNCFFNSLENTDTVTGYTFDDFADAVKKQRNCQKAKNI